MSKAVLNLFDKRINKSEIGIEIKPIVPNNFGFAFTVRSMLPAPITHTYMLLPLHS